jgi:hypothetical protein
VTWQKKKKPKPEASDKQDDYIFRNSIVFKERTLENIYLPYAIQKPRE